MLYLNPHSPKLFGKTIFGAKQRILPLCHTELCCAQWRRDGHRIATRRKYGSRNTDHALPRRHSRNPLHQFKAHHVDGKSTSYPTATLRGFEQSTQLRIKDNHCGTFFNSKLLRVHVREQSDNSEPARRAISKTTTSQELNSMAAETSPDHHAAASSYELLKGNMSARKATTGHYCKRTGFQVVFGSTARLSGRL